MNDSTVEHNFGDDAELDALLDEFGASVFRMGRLMASRHSPAHQQVDGFSAPVHMMLSIIDASGPLRVSDIAASLGVKSPAVSMLLRKLTKEGWVERHYDPDDRRAVLVSVSDAGREYLARSDDVQRAMMRRHTRNLSADDLRTLIRILGTLIETIETDDD